MPIEPGPTFLRPRDKSLQAFDEWLTDLAEGLAGKVEDDRTPAELRAAWLEFWGGELTPEELR